MCVYVCIYQTISFFLNFYFTLVLKSYVATFNCRQLETDIQMSTANLWTKQWFNGHSYGGSHHQYLKLFLLYITLADCTEALGGFVVSFCTAKTCIEHSKLVLYVCIIRIHLSKFPCSTVLYSCQMP